MFIVIIACLYSCKKKGGAVPFSNQKIATIDYTYLGEIQHYRIVYDQYDNVDSIVWVGDGTITGTGGYKTFSYFGSSFSITDNSGNSFVVDANTNGMILEILQADTLIMHYNSSNQLVKLDNKIGSTTPPYYTITSTNYTWVNGDMTNFGPAGTGNAYYYDMSKSGQPGDVLRINDFISYGRSYIKTTNLPRGLINSADTAESYSYQFDNMGRISELIKVNVSTNDTEFYAYKYY